MSKLKPIGSEKLTGQAKIDRILEISRYKENVPNPLNETEKIDFKIEMVDGEQYFIVKERLGYVIKKGLTESTADYIEPMKNRKYYPSYGKGLKRLNLIAKEVNSLHGNEEGLSLFGEQKKYTLKTPTPPPAPMPEPPTAEVPDMPPPVPSPELPPAPTEGGMDIPDAEMPMDDSGDLDLGGATQPIETPDAYEDDEVTFKTIQKITGKLANKLRVLDREKGMTSDEVKYVMNMLISALDLEQLTPEDMEDIVSRIEEKGEEYEGGEEGAEMGSEMPEPEMPDLEGNEVEPFKQEAGESYDHLKRYNESKIDKIISGYFELSESETKENDRKNTLVGNALKEINRLSESKEQEISSKSLLKKHPSAIFVGKTNLKNLVFEKNGKRLKVDLEGKRTLLK